MLFQKDDSTTIASIVERAVCLKPHFILVLIKNSLLLAEMLFQKNDSTTKVPKNVRKFYVHLIAFLEFAVMSLLLLAFWRRGM